MVKLIEVRYLEESSVSGGIYFPRMKTFCLHQWKNGREYVYSLEEVIERARKWLAKRNLVGSVYLLEYDNEHGTFIRLGVSYE